MPSHQGLPQASDPACCYHLWSGAPQQDTHTSKVLPSSGPIKHEGDSSWEVSHMARIKAALLVVSRLHRITNTAVFYTLLCKFPVSGSNRRPARPLLDNQ